MKLMPEETWPNLQSSLMTMKLGPWINPDFNMKIGLHNEILPDHHHAIFMVHVSHNPSMAKYDLECTCCQN